MLDFDLAVLYDVETRTLNQTVKRNSRRFPADFMFQITRQEFMNLKSQIVTSSWGYGGRRKLPLVVFDAIRELMTTPAPAKKGEIGFHTILKPTPALPAAKPANQKSKL